jgi:hypothetical protein
VGGVAAREVLPADAANLLLTTGPRRRTKDSDAYPPQPRVHGVSAERGEAGVRLGGRHQLDCARPLGDLVKTARDKADEKRAAKLALVQQVESGSLVIRQTTDAERRR